MRRIPSPPRVTEIKQNEIVAPNRTYLFLLYVELFDDDTDEQVQGKERPEHDEQHEVQVHVCLVFFVRLFVKLSPQQRDHLTMFIYSVSLWLLCRALNKS